MRAERSPPLGFSLSLRQRRAELVLGERRLSEGIVVRELRMLADRLPLPLDLRPGASALKLAWTELLSLTVELELALLGRRVEAALREAGEARRFSIGPPRASDRADATLELELEPARRFEVPLVLAAGPGTRLSLRLGLPVPRAADGLPELHRSLRAAIDLLYGNLWGSTAVLATEGIVEWSVEALDPALFALLPAAGWKLPRRDQVSLSRLSVEEGRLRLSFGSREPLRAAREPRLLEGSRAFADRLAVAPEPPKRAMTAVLKPARRRIAAVIAALDRARGSKQSTRAIAVARRLLGRDPLESSLLEALSRALDREGARAQPARRVLEAIRNRVSLPPLAASFDDPLALAHLASAALETPLGQLLLHSAAALAGLLPPPAPIEISGGRFRADEDPELARRTREIAAAAGVKFEALIELGTREVVVLEPGEPPILVIPAALAEDPDPGRLVFQLAGAAMRLRLGGLLLAGRDPTSALPWLALLRAAPDAGAESRLPPELREALGPLRQRLGPSGLAAIEELAGCADLALPALETWAASIELAAERFALLVLRDLEKSIEILERESPGRDARRQLAAFILGEAATALFGRGT